MTALPQLDRVAFRNFRGAADYPDLARIITASAQGEGDDRVETTEALASAYEHLERCDPAQRPPRGRGRRRARRRTAACSGIRSSTARASTSRSASSTPRSAAVASAPRCSRGTKLACVTSPRATSRPSRSSRRGRPTRTRRRPRSCEGPSTTPITYMAEMVRSSVEDLPDHPLPDGLEIRPVRDEDIRTIWEADVEAFKDHWGFVEQSDEDYERFIGFPYHDPTLWKIAWDDEGVAGQVKSFINTAENEAHGRQRGWTEAISTSRRWRRRGRREGAHRRVDPRARRSRDDRGRARRAHGEPERRVRALSRVSATRSSGRGRRTASRSELRLREDLPGGHLEDAEVDHFHAGGRRQLVPHRAARRPRSLLVRRALPERDEPRRLRLRRRRGRASRGSPRTRGATSRGARPPFVRSRRWRPPDRRASTWPRSRREPYASPHAVVPAKFAGRSCSESVKCASGRERAPSDQSVLAVLGPKACPGREPPAESLRAGSGDGPGWNRTNDLGIKSPLLCQLSYRPRAG